MINHTYYRLTPVITNLDGGRIHQYFCCVLQISCNSCYTSELIESLVYCLMICHIVLLSRLQSSTHTRTGNSTLGSLKKLPSSDTQTCAPMLNHSPYTIFLGGGKFHLSFIVNVHYNYWLRYLIKNTFKLKRIAGKFL